MKDTWQKKWKIVKSLGVFGLIILLMAALLTGCGSQTTKPPAQTEQTTQTNKRDFVATNGIVSAAHPGASNVGLEVLKKGGNAFDAAVAVSFSLGVMEPNASGIGGSGVAILYVAKENKSYVVDFQSIGPAKAKPDMSMWPKDKDGKILDKAKSLGYLSVCVPGQVRGMEVINQKFGKMKWADLLAPVIKQAENGLTVSETLNGVLTENFGDVDLYPSKSFFAKHFLEEGLPKSVGGVIKNAELATTMKKIAQGGADVFYTGEIADAIVKEFAKPSANGWITKEDLTNYKVIIREPIAGTYRGYQVFTPPPPCAGTTVMQILNIMEGFEVGKMKKDSAEFSHIFVEAQKLAWADQDKYAGDPDFAKVPTQGLISKKYAEELGKTINLEKTPGRAKAGNPGPHESPSTTSFTIVDKEGNMITVTQTLGHFMGAGVVPEGTGILMNDHMDTFSGRTASLNAPQGGKRVFSSMSGALVVKDGKPFMAMGSPGAARIISTTAEVIMNVVDFKMDLQAAIDAPRIHNRNSSLTNLEGRQSKELGAQLEGRGQKVVFLKEYDLFFGGVQGAMYTADGKIHGCADPRRDGVAAGY